MTPAILGAGSVLVLVLVIALAREVRLRRALQQLLRKLLAAWRNTRANHPSSCRDQLHDRDPGL